jgi:hypothetical protein
MLFTLGSSKLNLVIQTVMEKRFGKITPEKIIPLLFT